MLFSVIVPVYNSHEYLQKCLESISKQVFQDYEVLLVDDGSTDRSPSICHQYCMTNQHFRYIRRNENGGASAARNTGIDNAAGDYIIFVDNDDWLIDEHVLGRLEKEVALNGRPDILASSLAEAWPESKTITFPRNIPLPQNADYHEAALFLIESGQYLSSASSKIIKRTLVEQNRLKFNEKWKSNEDSDWSCELLLKASSIAWIDNPFYVYRRASSTSFSTKPITDKKTQDVSEIVDKYVNIAKTSSANNPNIELATCFIAYIYMILLSYLFQDDSPTKKELRRRQRNNSWLLKCSNNTRVKLSNAFFSLFGFNTTGKALAFVMKRERKKAEKR